jgi:hypothetical protein
MVFSSTNLVEWWSGRQDLNLRLPSPEPGVPRYLLEYRANKSKYFRVELQFKYQKDTRGWAVGWVVWILLVSILLADQERPVGTQSGRASLSEMPCRGTDDRQRLAWRFEPVHVNLQTLDFRIESPRWQT